MRRIKEVLAKNKGKKKRAKGVYNGQQQIVKVNSSKPLFTFFLGWR